MPTSPNSVDYEELYKSFSNLVFEKFGKKISDKDPVMLQFLMHELFSKDVSKRLSEFTTLQTTKLQDLANLWEKREDESFKNIDKSVQTSIKQIENFVNNDFRKSLGELYTENQKSFLQAIDQKLVNADRLLKTSSVVIYIVSCSVCMVLGAFLNSIFF